MNRQSCVHGACYTPYATPGEAVRKVKTHFTYYGFTKPRDDLTTTASNMTDWRIVIPFELDVNDQARGDELPSRRRELGEDIASPLHQPRLV